MAGRRARHEVRATRDEGQQTRAALLDAATELFSTRGFDGVALTEIATAADAFPSQVTYYFGGKDGLFVEVACRELLRVGSAVEAAGDTATTIDGYVRALVTTAVTAPGLLTFVEAMLLARRRRDLAPTIARTFARLHEEGERAVIDVLQRHGWRLHNDPATEARAFWATVIGVAVERAATGDEFDQETAEAAVRLVLNLEPDDPT